MQLQEQSRAQELQHKAQQFIIRSSPYPFTHASPNEKQFKLIEESAATSDTGEEYVPNTEFADQDICVVVRVRPLNHAELGRRDQNLITCFDDETSLQLSSGDGNNRPLTFNKVFSHLSSQEKIFNECGVKDLVMKSLQGYATTVFAFGQTGSGKTFTITGPGEENVAVERVGIIPRALKFLFDQVKKRGRGDNHGVQEKIIIKAAYLEIYNENVQDLLNVSSSSLAIRWNAKNGFYVENLFVVECETLDDCLAVLEEGLKNRRTGAHKLNEHSSRSHSIMTIYMDSESTSIPDELEIQNGVLPRKIKKSGKISFVDLAGSEKVKESKATGSSFVETLNINKSLLTLGNCISSLSDSKKRSGHIPYRDSKLTKLLADSLGGKGITLMIACVGPSTNCYNETLKTLRYAQRAKKIKNKPRIQIADPKEGLIAVLKRELKFAKMEGAALRAILGNEKCDNVLSKLSQQQKIQLQTYIPLPQIQGHPPPPPRHSQPNYSRPSSHIRKYTPEIKTHDYQVNVDGIARMLPHQHVPQPNYEYQVNMPNPQQHMLQQQKALDEYHQRKTPNLLPQNEYTNQPKPPPQNHYEYEVNISKPKRETYIDNSWGYSSIARPDSTPPMKVNSPIRRQYENGRSTSIPMTKSQRHRHHKGGNTKIPRPLQLNVVPKHLPPLPSSRLGTVNDISAMKGDILRDVEVLEREISMLK